MRKPGHYPLKTSFDDIALKYDKVNRWLSLGLYSHWGRILISQLLKRQKPEILLDLCCGTGETALLFLKEQKAAKEVFFVDISEEMLQCAHSKFKKSKFDDKRLHFLHVDSAELPLPSDSIDCVTNTYGLRNIIALEKSLAETFRVLKGGGTFAILELTRPKTRWLLGLYRFYLHRFVPKIGKWLSGNEKAYRYLAESIDAFMPVEELTALLQKEGFEDILVKPLSGGIVTMILAKKPSQPKAE
jgi:demethylmenaquinone methyltransferase/2-methoxy-6-polyprenyl-1,4-benzoquinol methylase